MNEAIDRAKQLRLASRSAASPERSLELLEEALQCLTEAVRASGPDHALYRDLAECLGMRGGVLRRMGKLDEAIASYQEGERFEQDEKFGADDSYNLVNALVVPLLRRPQQLDTDEVVSGLSKAVTLLRRQIRDSRRNDFWAQADLARCLLLQGKYDDAVRAIDRAVSQPIPKDGFVSTIQMLRELEEAFSAASRSETEWLRKAIEYLRRANEQGSSLQKPTCFVLMPFGKKSDNSGRTLDFNDTYERIIAPAILDVGLLPMRADAEMTGGIIHKAMLERLLLSELAIADLTLNNPNVFYELGVRHGACPRPTVLMSAEATPPFDVTMLRTLRYEYGVGDKVTEEEAARVRRALVAQLENARRALQNSTLSDNPIVTLVQDFKSLSKPSRFKVEVLRESTEYAGELKSRIYEAGKLKDVRKLREIEEHLPLHDTESGVMIDLMLAYRGLEAWDEMISFVAGMPKELRDTEMVREQHALALNRRNKGADQYRAMGIIEAVIAERGPSSESCSIMGRIHKDLWRSCRDSEQFRARGLLRKAIEAYRAGFDADIRDTYPGINLLTLLQIEGSAASLKEFERVCPVVALVAERRPKDKRDYWDHATLLELAVLLNKTDEIVIHLSDAMASAREMLEPKTTSMNLRLIRDARAARNIASPMLDEAIAQLEQLAQSMRAR